MAQKSLMLGESCLDKYVFNPEKLEAKRKKELGELIKDLEKDKFNVETLPIQMLKIDFNGYPIIDPCFLSMGLDVNGYRLPRFAVHKRSEQGFEDFGIKFVYLSNERKSEAFEISFTNKQKEGPRFPKELTSPIFQGYSFTPSRREIFRSDSTEYHGYIPRENKEFTEHFIERLNGNLFRTSFNGIIPKESKKKIAEADEIFGNDLYLITETKPEDWVQTRLFLDPLIIGVLKEKELCFLVDHFNTTSIEDYVRKEFAR